MFFNCFPSVQVSTIGGDDVYVKHAAENSVHLASVLGRVALIRDNGDKGAARKKSDILYRLPAKEKLKIEKILKLKNAGYRLNVYEKDYNEERTCDILVMEPPDDGEDDDDDGGAVVRR